MVWSCNRDHLFATNAQSSRVDVVDVEVDKYPLVAMFRAHAKRSSDGCELNSHSCYFATRQFALVCSSMQLTINPLSSTTSM